MILIPDYWKTSLLSKKIMINWIISIFYSSDSGIICKRKITDVQIRIIPILKFTKNVLLYIMIDFTI